jgi:spermidine/putrescine transport system substrate-binding protein
MILFWVVLILLFLQFPKYVHLFSSKKTLYVATWPLLIDAQYIHAFEKKAGVKLEISYFERSEELYSKLKATGGHGYDIIFPSDYTVDLLIKKDLLKKIDKSKLDFWDRLDPKLLDNYFDPNNDYSIPFFWGVYGIGFNKKIYGDDPTKTWGLLFAPTSQHIVMSDNPREMALMATQYLYGDLDFLRKADVQKEVINLLADQKKSVDIYTDERLDELLSSENSYLAFGLSTDVSRAARMNSNVGFFIPDEGSFLIIDSIAIAKHSKNEALAYAFINYLYQEEVINYHIDLYNMCSPLLNSKKSDYCPSDETFSKLSFLTDVINEDELNDIWINFLAN